jgi:hypothetical protein
MTTFHLQYVSSEAFCRLRQSAAANEFRMAIGKRHTMFASAGRPTRSATTNCNQRLAEAAAHERVGHNTFWAEVCE